MRRFRTALVTIWLFWASGAAPAFAQPTPPVAPDVLRQGGHVILLRHAATERVDEPSPIDLTNCSVQHRLTDKGRADARAIGEAFRSLNIPVGRVLASEYCRTLETGHLAFGRAEPSEMLLHPLYVPVPGAPVPAAYEQRVERLKQALATTPAPGTNTVLISHGENIRDALGFEVAQGEAVIFRPDGRGGAAQVGRFLPDQWLAQPAPAQAPRALPRAGASIGLAGTVVPLGIASLLGGLVLLLRRR